MESPAVAGLPLAGRVAIVTGSTRGIGRAIALHLASLGARIVINYISSADIADLLVSQLNSSAPAASHSTSPLRAIAVQGDVSDPDAVRNLFDRAEQAFGSPPHIVVSNAGIFDLSYPTITETAVEVFDRTFAVNTRATFLCCREAASRVVRGGGGRIITFSASVTVAPPPGTAAYTASVAAVEAITRVLAKELKGTEITANCVAPGPVATDAFLKGKSEEQVAVFGALSPAGRIGKPEEIAEVVGFLARDEAEWVNGQVIRVNGGMI